MKWRGERESDNIEDRRSDGGLGGGGFGGGLGGGGFGGGPLGGIRLAGGSWKMMLLLVVVYFVLKMMGIDAGQLLDGGSPRGPGITQSQSSSASGGIAADEMTSFVRTVLGTTEDAWTGIFKASGGTYERPKLVLFSGQTQSACGFASAATGPFYCPGDRKVFLDTDFFQELSDRFGASGEFADAYVIAHEVGHHVQNLLGILPKFNKLRQSMSEVDSNRMSVRVELQADCFAGIWAKYAEGRGIVEPGDMESALNAAKQIGDDTLQKRSQGYVVPDSFNHGTSAQRMRWLKRGYDTGDLNQCDTFSGKI
nr:neutral zinc metallopeptidase [uncultured Gellertiella sp.]